MDDYYKASSSYLDEPANSRLFLVTSKTITENTIREHFTAFGEIQDVWLVKDKHTKESKGVGFVKFAKSSQACTAMEEMHGRCLEEGTKPLKVFIAQSRSSGSHRDVEDEDLTRIFVMIPKTFTEEDLKETFRVYGNIEYASIIKNKGTGESKGLGYVTFHKPSQAATAIENCEKSFRAILAEPKNKSADNDYFSNFRTENDPGLNLYPHAHESSSFSGGDASRSTEVMTRCLMVSSRSALPKEHVYALFDLIPGMEYAEPHRDPYNFSNGQLIVRYNSLGSAVYAKEKLNGFEYPPGNRLSVSFVDDGDDRTSPVMNMAVQLVAAQMMSMVWNNSSGSPLTKTSTNSFVPQKSRVQTDVSLPPLKSLEQPDTPVAERLFVIFNPSPLPVDVLEDVFCRFGSLVEVYLVPGRNLGYIKYGDRTNAHEAMTLMHGKVVNGVRMKVMLADPPKTESHKRQRTY